MASLPQYGAYAFIPYLDSLQPPINSFKVHNTSSWTYVGPLLQSDPSNLPSSLRKWSLRTFSNPDLFTNRLITLLSFLRTFLSQPNLQHYWLTIRATQPTKDYDVPRWHIDDDFFASPLAGRNIFPCTSPKSKYGPGNWKLATTLLGPPTLFQSSNSYALSRLQSIISTKRSAHQHLCSSIRCLGCATYADDVRASMAQVLADQDTTSPAWNEVAFFRLGNDHGAVHSEPKCDVDRVFVNIVPGNEVDLKAFMASWGMEYPRAWCIGVSTWDYTEHDL